MCTEEWRILIQNLIDEGVLHSPHVIRAMRVVDRAQFLPTSLQPHASSDTPFPIGFGQTISAPHSWLFGSQLGETWFQ